MDFFLIFRHSDFVKKIVYWSTLSFFLFIAASCSQDPAIDVKNGLEFGLKSPIASDGISFYKSSNPEAGQSSSQTGVSTKAAIPDDFLIQLTLEANLDTDTALEQIIIYKNKNDLSDLIRLAVSDFDSNRSEHSLSWSTATKAVNARQFSLRFVDITGDGIPDILANGVDANGLQTMDIFKMDTSRSLFPLQMKSILSVSASIGIELRQRQETDGEFNQSQAEFSVVVQNKIGEENTSSDLQESVYRWQTNQDTFVFSSSQNISGKLIQNKQMEVLFKSGTESMEKFLAGAWKRTSINSRQRSIEQILFFDPEYRSFRIIEGDRLESHIWRSSGKPSAYGRMEMYLVNEAFKTLRSTAIIVPIAVDSIEFSLQDKNNWTGSYVRVDFDQDSRFSKRDSRSGIPINRLILSGIYRDEKKHELIFTAPFFYWRQNGIVRKGSYLTYETNETVLELQFVSDSGIVEEKKYYIVKLLDPRNATIGRFLELIPARTNINGVEKNSGEIIRLEFYSSEVE